MAVPQEKGILEKVWYDLLFSEKNATAVICLHTYGYLISILMTSWGAGYFLEFGRESTLYTKLAFQILGLTASLIAVYACYKNQPQKLSFFFVYQFLHTLLIFFGLYYVLFKASRSKVFKEYVTEPFYNIKLIDQPFLEKYKVLDMASEPAYEISLLYFRANYMMLITIFFNCYAMYAVYRKICLGNIRVPVHGRDSQEMRDIQPAEGPASSNDEQGEPSSRQDTVRRKATLAEKVLQLLGN